MHGTIKLFGKTYITIHEASLGLETTPADRTIAYYENKLLNPQRDGTQQLGYHFMVSDEEVVQFISTKFRTAHAGCYEGNNSIAIQRIVNCNVDFEKAIYNQAKLATTLCLVFNVPTKNIVPRSYWGKSESPTRLLASPDICNIPGNKTWKHFMDIVNDCYWKDTFNGIIL